MAARGGWLPSASIKSIREKLQKIVGKSRENHWEIASRSNTSAQVAQNVSVSPQTWSTGITITGGSPQYHWRINRSQVDIVIHFVLPLGSIATP
jgi:hypothetical protein